MPQWESFEGGNPYGNSVTTILYESIYGVLTNKNSDIILIIMGIQSI